MTSRTEEPFSYAVMKVDTCLGMENVLRTYYSIV